MKGPEYVANVVDKYRRALEAALEQRPSPLTDRDEEELRYSFSRSFSHGFLKGADHQDLVHGLYPGHRGVLVGRVEEVHARARHVLVRAEPGAPGLKAGDRILFDRESPRTTSRAAAFTLATCWRTGCSSWSSAAPTRALSICAWSRRETWSGRRRTPRSRGG